MTPIAYETIQYLRKVNTVFNDKNRVFDMMTKILSALPDFARDQVIAEMLPNIKFNTDIQVNADGTEIRTSNAPEFLESPVELDAMVHISLPKDAGRDGTPFTITRLDALKDALGISAFKGNKILTHLVSNASKPGMAAYCHRVRGADLPRIVEQLTAAGFFVR